MADPIVVWQDGDRSVTVTLYEIQVRSGTDAIKSAINHWGNMAIRDALIDLNERLAAARRDAQAHAPTFLEQLIDECKDTPEFKAETAELDRLARDAQAQKGETFEALATKWSGKIDTSDGVPILYPPNPPFELGPQTVRVRAIIQEIEKEGE